MGRLCLPLAVLMLGAACGSGDDEATDAPLPRTRRVAMISRVEGEPPIESIFTPFYDGGHILAVNRRDPFVDKDILFYRYSGDNLISASDGKNTMRYAWNDGRVTQQLMNGVPIDYTYEDDLLASANYNGDELGHYRYENRRLVMLDLQTGTDVHFSYDAQERLTGVTGRPETVYSYIGDQVSTVQASNELWAITYERGLVKTISRSGIRTPITITYTYADEDVVGVNLVPPIPQAAMFGLDGRPLPTVELLSADLTGNAFSAFGTY